MKSMLIITHLNSFVEILSSWPNFGAIHHFTRQINNIHEFIQIIGVVFVDIVNNASPEKVIQGVKIGWLGRLQIMLFRLDGIVMFGFCSIDLEICDKTSSNPLIRLAFMILCKNETFQFIGERNQFCFLDDQTEIRKILCFHIFIRTDAVAGSFHFTRHKWPSFI